MVILFYSVINILLRERWRPATNLLAGWYGRWDL